jgi:hypothetical protein
MKIFLALLLLSPVGSLAQSPFDGIWIIDTNTTQLPQKPTLYSLAKGMFRWAGTEGSQSQWKRPESSGQWLLGYDQRSDCG